MTSIPADNAETDYAAGAIQFNWSDDDGYAGDTYKTVTLNEATHEGPDGESMDILDQLTTNDNKKWVLRPAEDLALGAHEFTLKATDAAGNSNTVSTTITVIERDPVAVDLSPGWEPDLVPRRARQPGRKQHIQQRQHKRGVAVRRAQGVPVDGLDAAAQTAACRRRPRAGRPSTPASASTC